MLLDLETELSALGDALRHYDDAAIEEHARELHRALVRAVDGFSLAARQGLVPPPLRSRLVLAGRKVAAQRESLARATFALDRAIDSLLPREAAVAYSPRTWGARATF